jgi:hypothetical protein
MPVSSRRIGGYVGAGTLLVAMGVVPAACGARSGLRTSDAGADAGQPETSVTECAADEECPTDLCERQRCVSGRCQTVSAVMCDDGDPCTEDSCDPSRGTCRARELALDQDGDGFKGPRPGFAPGAPESCGSDCDDTSAKAFPGGFEECDGVDNDCDGNVDEMFTYQLTDPSSLVQVSSGDYQQARRGALAHNGDFFAATYHGRQDRWSAFLKGIDDSGVTVLPETTIPDVNSDTFAGGLVWTGNIFGTAWEDRRDGDYEIYFNRLNAQGQKLGPDIRISNANDFSLEPSVVWNGLEFLVIWEDRRDIEPRIFGQRVALDGSLVGGNVPLTETALQAESPSVAVGKTSMAIAFVRRDGSIGWRTVSPDLSVQGPVVTVSEVSAQSPALVFSDDRYVLAWERYDNGPGDAIWGRTLSETGQPLSDEMPLTWGAQFARTPALFPLGERAVLVWAEENGQGHFQLMTAVTFVDPLTPVPNKQAVSFADDDALFPTLAPSDDGQIGVLFEGHANGAWQVYLSRLTCVAGP